MTDEMTFTWYSTARDILCNLADFDLDDPGRLDILDNQIALIAALPPGGLYDSARSQLRSLPSTWANQPSSPPAESRERCSCPTSGGKQSKITRRRRERTIRLKES